MLGIALRCRHLEGFVIYIPVVVIYYFRLDKWYETKFTAAFLYLFIRLFIEFKKNSNRLQLHT